MGCACPQTREQPLEAPLGSLPSDIEVVNPNSLDPPRCQVEERQQAPLKAVVPITNTLDPPGCPAHNQVEECKQAPLKVVVPNPNSLDPPIYQVDQACRDTSSYMVHGLDSVVDRGAEVTVIPEDRQQHVPQCRDRSLLRERWRRKDRRQVPQHRDRSSNSGPNPDHPHTRRHRQREQATLVTRQKGPRRQQFISFTAASQSLPLMPPVPGVSNQGDAVEALIALCPPSPLGTET